LVEYALWERDVARSSRVTPTFAFCSPEFLVQSTAKLTQHSSRFHLSMVISEM